MRIRRLNPPSQLSNPFVVLSDVTISLVIIFLVFGIGAAISNNQLLLYFDRNERQEAIGKELVDAITRVLPDSAIAQDLRQRDPRTHIEFRQGGRLVAELWRNSSFQRVSVYGEMFAPNSASLTPFGLSLVREVGQVVRANAKQFSYLFINGITEPSEIVKPTIDNGLKLSQDRAWVVRQALIEQGAIGPEGIEPKYAIPYGIGSELYATGALRSGRVDLVLFYGDVGESKATRSGGVN